MFELERAWSAARSLFVDGHFLQAAFAYERALSVAKRHGLTDDVASLLSDVAIAWENVGESGKALSALLALRESGMATVGADLEAKIQRTSFHIMYEESPELAALEERIAELDSLSRSNGDRYRGEVCSLRNLLFTARGRWLDALAESEAQWSNRETLRKCESCGLSDLVDDSLDANDQDKAGVWLGRLKECHPAAVSCRTNSLRSQCKFALAFGHSEDAIRLSEDALEISDTASSSYGQTLELRVRCLLLDSDLGDPLSVEHPGRSIILRERYRPRSLSKKFNRNIFLSDYRLACLRYAAGFRPVDDLYYSRAEQKSGRAALDAADIEERAEKALAAVRRGTSIAQKLDAAFGSSWRNEKLELRKERIMRIVSDAE